MKHSRNSSRRPQLSRFVRTTGLVGSLLLGACGSPPPPETPPPASPAPSTSGIKGPVAADSGAPQTLPFLAAATAATESLAYEQATFRLAVALLDDESLQDSDDLYSRRIAACVHSKESDPYESRTTPEGVHVEIGLSQEGLENSFSRIEQGLLAIELPQLSPIVAAPVRALRLATRFDSLCTRQQELLPSSECEGADIQEAKLNLSIASQKIRFTPALEGGLPHDETRFLRPLRLRVWSAHDKGALFGVPLLLTRQHPSHDGGTQALRLITDSAGRVEATIPEDWSLDSSITVAVDATKLLGSQATAWNGRQLQITGRAVGIARAALVFDESDPVARATAKSLRASLKLIVPQPVPLSPEISRKLLAAPAAQRRQLAIELADRLAGSLDTLLFITAKSEFASRMGTHRVWYEARGKLVGLNAWNGELLHEFDATVTESGVGEARANEAASDTLGGELAQKLQSALDPS